MTASGEPPCVDIGDTCDRCGKEAAGVVGELTLCESCYHGETSCCGRFSDEDL